MEAILEQINFVAERGHYVSPDLHLLLRERFRGETTMEEAKEIAALVLSPLLQQMDVPSDGAIELLDLIGSLVYILDQEMLAPFAEWLFQQFLCEPWSSFCAAALYTTLIQVLKCNHNGINIKTGVEQVWVKVKEISSNIPTEKLPDFIKAIVTSLDEEIFSEQEIFRWIELACIELIPKVSPVDIPTVFYIIELSIQYSPRLPAIILQSTSPRNKKHPNPQQTQSKCILLLLLANLQRYQDLCYQRIEEHMNSLIKFLLSRDTLMTCFEICSQLIDFIMEYPGMENRTQNLVEGFFYLLESSSDNLKQKEVYLDFPIIFDATIDMQDYLESPLIPLTHKLAQYGLLQCFIRWPYCREFVLKELFQILCHDAPSTLTSHTLQLVHHNITENTPIPFRALLITQFIEVLTSQFTGTLDTLHYIIFEWFSEISTIRETLAVRVQRSVLQLVRTQSSHVQHILILLQKNLHSNQHIERKLALQGLCYLFSFYTTDTEKQNEFLLILKSALSLPLLYRQNTYHCLLHYIIRDVECQFPLSTKKQVLDLLLSRLKRYTIYVDNCHLISMEQCFESVETWCNDETELCSRENWEDLFRCIILLSKICHVSLRIVDDIQNQLIDASSVHELIFTVNENAMIDTPISPVDRMDMLIGIYHIYMDEIWREEFVHLYSVLLYVRYHSEPHCKWNTHWQFYLPPEKTKSKEISLQTSLKVSEYYSTQFKDNKPIPLLNLYIQCKWVLSHLETDNTLEISDARRILAMGYKVLLRIREQKNTHSLAVNHREQLVNFDLLLKILPSGGAYEKLILHCNSKETTCDLLDGLHCLVLTIYSTVIQHIPISKRIDFADTLNELFAVEPAVSGKQSWLCWAVQLISWLEEDFTHGISEDLLKAYVDVIPKCCAFDSSFMNDDEALVIEDISARWLEILKTYTIDQSKLIRTILEFLFSINSSQAAIPIARSVMLSILNEPIDDDDPLDEDEERLLLTETKTCRTVSLRCVLDFYKKSLADYRNRNVDMATDISELQWIIPPSDKSLLGDLFKILQFVMTEKMEFIEQHKQLHSFWMLMSSVIVTGHYFCSLAIKKKYLPLLQKELQVESDIGLESLQITGESSCSSLEFPTSNFLLGFHSIVSFCYVLDQWMGQHRALLSSGKLPEMILKKEKFLSSAHALVGTLSVLASQSNVTLIQNTLSFVDQNKLDTFQVQRSDISYRPSRKRKRLISSENPFIRDALQEDGNDDDDYSDLEDFIVCGAIPLHDHSPPNTKSNENSDDDMPSPKRPRRMEWQLILREVMEKPTLLVTLGVSLLGLGVAAFIVHRMMNHKVVIFTRNSISGIELTDGAAVEIVIDLRLEVVVPSKAQTHAFVTENTERIAKQTAQSVLSPYNEADMNEKQLTIKNTLRKKLTENLAKAGYTASDILIDTKII